MARVQTYRDVLQEFRTHPEAKSAVLDRRPCCRQTLGLLLPRVVLSLPELTTHVGKEANKLEEVDAEIEHDAESIWMEYADPRRDPWTTTVLPLLQRQPQAALAPRCGLSDRQLRNLISGRSRPRASTQTRIVEALKSLDLVDSLRVGCPEVLLQDPGDQL